MVWLFTQVWLWSLAAFALGALITWLLFVRPLKRRLRELVDAGCAADDYVDPDTAVEQPLDLLVAEEPVEDWDPAPRPYVERVARAEAEGAPAADSDGGNTWFRKAAGTLPAEQPAEAETTEVLPRVADDELPRRTPGAGPRPGREEPDADATEEPEPEPAAEESEPELAAAEPEPAVVEPEPERPRGPVIKGHSASRQYHTPESPSYDQIVADVWFRTPSDAEIAGFAPWNGKRARD